MKNKPYDYEPLSEIELEIEYYGARAILVNPPPPWTTRNNLWICDDKYAKAELDWHTVECFKERLCPESPRGFANWAIMVGKVVAERVGAKIIREVHFDLARFPNIKLRPDDHLWEW